MSAHRGDVLTASHRTPLGQGIESTYNWFLANQASARGVVTTGA